MAKFTKNTLALRQSGKLGHYKSTNRPVSFPKGVIYEVIRIVDNSRSYVRVNNNVYLVKNKDIVLTEQTVDYPQQMADFAPPPQKPISLDQVVDRYIVRYERESIPLQGEPGPGPIDANAPSPTPQAPNSGVMQETELLDVKSLVSFLFEQAPPPPADDEPPPEEEPPPGDPGGGAPIGGGDDLGLEDPSAPGGAEGGEGGSPPVSPPVENTPKINLNDFCRSVARLINNYDALLNPRTIIVNRIEAYIANNYDERTAKHFMQIMERNYGLHPTEVEYGNERNEFPTPVAGSALLGGGGGGG